jgi:hypothetical protein
MNTQQDVTNILSFMNRHDVVSNDVKRVRLACREDKAVIELNEAMWELAEQFEYSGIKLEWSLEPLTEENCTFVSPSLVIGNVVGVDTDL